MGDFPKRCLHFYQITRYHTNMNQFITIKNDGNYFPMDFIVRNNESGKMTLAKKETQNLLDEGDTFVVVEFNEVN